MPAGGNGGSIPGKKRPRFPGKIADFPLDASAGAVLYVLGDKRNSSFFLREIGAAEGGLISVRIGGKNRAYKNYTGVHRVQAEKLQHEEGQEGASGAPRDEEILQILQEAYGPQRDEIKKGAGF